MLTSVAAALFLAAAVVVLRGLVAGRMPHLSVATLLLLSVASATPGVLNLRLEQRLSGVATVLAGRDVTVRCQTFGAAFVDAGGELGYVRFRADGTPESHTLMKREQCGHLRSYLGSPSVSHGQVIAVHVLVHEAMHLRGIASEAEAECRAVQRDATAARLLGASPDSARQLARTYWQQVYPHMPAEYRSAECRAGGGYDEQLPDAPW